MDAVRKASQIHVQINSYKTKYARPLNVTHANRANPDQKPQNAASDQGL